MTRPRAPRNIVHYVTGQYMRQNKKRSLTTFFGIVFTVLLMTCVFVGRESAITYLEEVASQKNGKWHYTLYDITPQKRAELEALPYVSGTAAALSLGLTDFPASANPERPYLNVKAYEPQAISWNNIRLTEGRLPENGGEILLSSACLKDGSGVTLGDSIDARFFQRSITGLPGADTTKTYFPALSLEIARGETKDLPLTFPHFPENIDFRIDLLWTGQRGHYTVVGFMEPPSFEPSYAAGYTALTLAEPDSLALAESYSLFLQTSTNRDTPAGALSLLWQIAGEENVESNDYLLAFSGNSSDSTMNLMVDLMTGFFLLLILAVSVVLIYNVFNISFRERSRYLGMLSSVGATARQKRSSVYFEAGILLLAALPVGILAGFGVVLGGLRIMEPYVVQLVYGGIQQEAPAVSLTLSWQALAAVALASVVTVLLSAFLPAWKIGKIGPIASIQGGHVLRAQKGRAKTHIRGGAEGMLAHSFLHRQGRNQRSLFLAVTAFLLVLTVASFGVSQVIGIIEYKADAPVSLDVAVQERDCILHYDRSSEDGPAFYNALKQALETRPEVASLKPWYSSMFALDVDTSFYSEEYWAAFLDIAEEYLGQGFSREELEQKYVLDRNCTVNLLVPDDETLRQIAKRCGADQALVFEGLGAILLNEVQLDTDSYGFELREPRHYRYYDIQQPSACLPGDSFPVTVYNAALEQAAPAQLTLAGYANNDQCSPFFSVHGGTPCTLEYGGVWAVGGLAVGRTAHPTGPGGRGLCGLPAPIRRGLVGNASLRLERPGLPPLHHPIPLCHPTGAVGGLCGPVLGGVPAELVERHPRPDAGTAAGFCRAALRRGHPEAAGKHPSAGMPGHPGEGAAPLRPALWRADLSDPPPAQPALRPPGLPPPLGDAGLRPALHHRGGAAADPAVLPAGTTTSPSPSGCGSSWPGWGPSCAGASLVSRGQLPR